MKRKSLEDMISHQIENEAVFSLSIKYEIILDSGVYTIPYSFCTVFISVFTVVFV